MLWLKWIYLNFLHDTLCRNKQSSLSLPLSVIMSSKLDLVVLFVGLFHSITAWSWLIKELCHWWMVVDRTNVVGLIFWQTYRMKLSSLIPWVFNRANASRLGSVVPRVWFMYRENDMMLDVVDLCQAGFCGSCTGPMVISFFRRWRLLNVLVQFDCEL